VSKIKAFMSCQADFFRPPYGRRPAEQKRQCVCAGTVNGSEYLRDETGGRRWWPWPCTKINIPGLSEVRDQLWAEARARYDQHRPWWLDTKELNGTATEEQDARLIQDAWFEEIRRHVTGLESIGVGDLLGHVGVHLQDRDQRHANRIAACLKALGWRVRSTRVDDKPHPVKRYYPPDGGP
jgi:predicted P-loop ATPase